MKKRSGHILIFARYPKAGAVKTRLARDIGDVKAAIIYRSLVRDIVKNVKASGFPFTVCYDPPESCGCFRQWLGEELSYAPQNGTDLGERMKNAFAEAFSHGAENVFIIGSDIPDLTAESLSEAVNSLERHDAVLGPAADGGYYLIGFRKNTFSTRVFSGIEWSTNRVFAATMRLLSEEGLRVHLLPELRDVDTIEDLMPAIRCGVNVRPEQPAPFKKR